MAEANNIFDSPITNFRIAEAAADGMLIDVHVISPGWGSFGYYSESALQSACANGVYPAGMHMHIDHPTRKAAQEQPGRTIKGESPLAAIFTKAGHYDPNGWDKTAENPTGAGIYSVAKVLPTFVEDMKAMAGNIGISHYVEGKRESGVAPDGRKGQIIKELVADQFNTVDFVTVPGAKGKYRLAFSEMKIRQNSTENAEQSGENMGNDKQESLTLSEVRTSHPEIFEEMKKTISEELKIEAVTKDQTIKLNEAATKIKTLEQENKGLKTTIAEGKAREFVAVQLKEAKIPEVSGKVLTESLIKQVVLSEDGSINAAEFGKIVTDAVKVKAEEIAAILKESKTGIHGNGESAPIVGDVKKAQESYIRVLVEGGMSEEQAKKMAEA